MRCPHCGRQLSDRAIARHLAAKGGGSRKRQRSLSREQATAMARQRWAGVTVMYTTGPGQRKLQTGTLTTAHAASSYGAPVLVAQDGTALGPADIGGAILEPPQATSRERQLLDAARRAGYRIEPA